jgi:hypothetical protein
MFWVTSQYSPWTLSIEATSFAETLIKIYCSVRHHIAENSILPVREILRNLHNEELYDSFFLPNSMLMFASRRIRQKGHVACMGENRNAYRLLMAKP